MPTRLCVMPSTSGGSYKLGAGVHRMGGEGVQHLMLGKGAGGVLLNGGTGGQSGAGSYSSLDDYRRTTGMNPIMREVKGSGLEKLGSKISGLSIIPPKKKKNNIKFEL
jgi:hypothetical protein